MRRSLFGAMAIAMITGLPLISIGIPAWSAEKPNQIKRGRDLFTRGAGPACSICHALKDAGAEGAVGPNLDELKPSSKRVAAALRNGIGQMPSYRGSLTDEQIATLAAYVSKSSGAPN